MKRMKMNRAEVEQLKQLAVEMRSTCADLKKELKKEISEGKRNRKLHNGAMELLSKFGGSYRIQVFRSGVPAATQKLYFKLGMLTYSPIFGSRSLRRKVLAYAAGR
jgi:hypothetical protein